MLKKIDIADYDVDRYDYFNAIVYDVYNYALEGFVPENYSSLSNEEQELIKDKIFDFCYQHSEVTGNENGSYWCNRYRAELALCHNLSLVEDALYQLEVPCTYNPEELDYYIRVYLLRDCIEAAIEQYLSKH